MGVNTVFIKFYMGMEVVYSGHLCVIESNSFLVKS